ncbi:MAG: RHS repeat-associated core domain-containing protein [Thermodesulfobacteriota bacterium]
MASDRSGAKTETTEYLPFGGTGEHTGTKVSDYKFTDQELDSEVGLYNYNARLYDPVIGRFISADTIVPDFSNPQDLDRYAYCGNNPLNTIDPTGHFSIGKFFKIFAVAVVAAVVTVVTYGAALPAVAAAMGVATTSVAAVTATMAVAGAVGGALAGGLGAAINGGSPADIFKGIMMGGVMGAIGGGACGMWGAPAAYAMLAAGAGYSAYKGGLEGLAYFGAGVAGAMVGGAIGNAINKSIASASVGTRESSQQLANGGGNAAEKALNNELAEAGVSQGRNGEVDITDWQLTRDVKEAAIQTAREHLTTDMQEVFVYNITRARVFLTASDISPISGEKVCGYAPVGGRDIRVTPSGFYDSLGCGFAETVFHETMHLIGFGKGVGSHDIIRMWEGSAISLTYPGY